MASPAAYVPGREIQYNKGGYTSMTDTGHKTTAAMRAAIAKYDAGFDRVNCRFPQGTKARIEKVGYKSINTFICSAVAEKLEREEKFLK